MCQKNRRANRAGALHYPAKAPAKPAYALSASDHTWLRVCPGVPCAPIHRSHLGSAHPTAVPSNHVEHQGTIFIVFALLCQERPAHYYPGKPVVHPRFYAPGYRISPPLLQSRCFCPQKYIYPTARTPGDGFYCVRPSMSGNALGLCQRP